MKYASFILALLAIIPLTIYPTGIAHADSNLSTRTTEWAGIKNIMSVMGQGTYNANDQKSLLDILDAKSAVEEGNLVPSSTNQKAEPVSAPSKTLPPRHRPSAF